jgi:hypothetical protein
LFGLAARWKRNRPNRLEELARAIEAIGDDDRRLLDESVRVERLRQQGAGDLYEICRDFVDTLNARLSTPALTLDPPHYSNESYPDGAPALFQINLRGRLLQIEFQTTDELSSTEDFRRPYVLYGTVRSFNQDFLAHDTVDEKALFYCMEGNPENRCARWHYFDSRTYASGALTRDFLVGEMARLL